MSKPYKVKSDIINAVLIHYGSQRALARALCVTEGAVSRWISAGFFPSTQAIRIERAIGIRAVDLVKPE